MNRDIPFSAVIFDMDGLMLDTESMTRSAWQRAAADWGYTILDDTYLKAVGRRIQDTKTIFQETLGKGFPFHAIRKRKLQYVEEYIAQHGIPIKPGLAELLDLIDQSSLMKAVASSTERKGVIQKLTMVGLVNRFDAIVCGDEVQNGKPAPDIFLAVAKHLDIPAEQCIVLEDSDAGVQAAHTAGMIPIMVPDLKQPSKKTASLAYKIFHSLHEVRYFLFFFEDSKKHQKEIEVK